jgi:Exopolyphosphatase-related proteins
MNATFEEIAAALAPAKSVLVVSHLRPDGDALGSTLAIAIWLRSLGKEVTAWNESGLATKFRYLPCWEMLELPSPQARTFDAIVAVDCSSMKRLGTVLDGVAIPPVFVNIDHHVSNERYGTLNHVDSTSPATGQIVYEFLESRGARITPEIAGNLFAAISTDTGSFQYSNTTARTFAVASALVAAGVNVGELSQAIYDTQPRRHLELLRHALNDAEFFCDDRVACTTLTRVDAERLGIQPEDTEGIINHLRSVDTVVAAVFFEEIEDGRVRVSSRSKDPRVDVCKVCAEFGGGGHPLASGARIRGPVDEVKRKFLKVLCDEVSRIH